MLLHNLPLLILEGRKGLISLWSKETQPSIMNHKSVSCSLDMNPRLPKYTALKEGLEVLTAFRQARMNL